MKPNPPTKQAARLPKLPKARVMYITDHEYFRDRHAILWTKKGTDYKPVAVLPAHTVTEARALIRVAGFFAMGEGEQRFAIAKEYAAFEMGLPSLSPAGFRGLKPICIVEACKFADRVLTLIASGGARK